MADSIEDPRLAVIRARLIRLLDEAEYRITRRALEDGLKVLKEWEVTPTEWGLVEFILRRLRGGHASARRFKVILQAVTELLTS